MIPPLNRQPNSLINSNGVHMTNDPCLTKEQVRDKVIRTLCDNFEHGNKRVVSFDMNNELTVEERPAYDEFVGEALANGWIVSFYGSNNLFHLTPEGYRQFIPLVRAMRAFD